MNDELEREREERLLQLTALACQAEEDKEYEKFLNSEEYVPPDAAWMEKVDRELRAPKKRRLPHFRRLVVLAASLIILLSIGVGTAIANPKALENLFRQDHERYSQVRVDDGVVLEKLEGWESEYYPTWAPKGFAITDILQTGDLRAITLSNKSNEQIVFSILTSRKYGFPNTEELANLPVTIFGEEYSAYLSENGTRVLLIIPENDCSIVIDGKITPEELVKFAENIKNIN